MRFVTGVGALGAVACLMLPAAAMSAEMRGVTATEIKIGQTMPYSGPVSAFGALGKGEVGYFKMVNERGGINGRRCVKKRITGEGIHAFARIVPRAGRACLAGVAGRLDRG